MGILCEDRYTFLITSCSILRMMRNVSDRGGRESQNTYFMLKNFFFLNHAIYEIMWINMVQQGRPQMTVWCMRIACWIPKATGTLS